MSFAAPSYLLYPRSESCNERSDSLRTWQSILMDVLARLAEGTGS